MSIICSIVAALYDNNYKRYENGDDMVVVMSQGGSVLCEGRDDAMEFANIRSAMKVLTYTDDEIQNLYRVLAAVLHLGNIEYRGMSVSNIALLLTAKVKPIELVDASMAGFDHI